TRSCVLRRSLCGHVERSLHDDAREVAPVVGRGEIVAEDLRLVESGWVAACEQEGMASDARDRDGSRTVTSDLRRRARELEAGCRVLDTAVRGARSRCRKGHDYLRHQLLRSDRGREGPEEERLGVDGSLSVPRL